MDLLFYLGFVDILRKKFFLIITLKTFHHNQWSEFRILAEKCRIIHIFKPLSWQEEKEVAWQIYLIQNQNAYSRLETTPWCIILWVYSKRLVSEGEWIFFPNPFVQDRFGSQKLLTGWLFLGFNQQLPEGSMIALSTAAVTSSSSSLLLFEEFSTSAPSDSKESLITASRISCASLWSASEQSAKSGIAEYLKRKRQTTFKRIWLS